jgi:hypothetical protein
LQVEIDRLKSSVKKDLMKYSITVHHGPIPRRPKPEKKKDSSACISIEDTPEPKSKLTVDEAIAMTASRIVKPKGFKNMAILGDSDAPRSKQDAFTGGNSVLSHLLRPTDAADSNEKLILIDGERSKRNTPTPAVQSRSPCISEHK